MNPLTKDYEKKTVSVIIPTYNREAMLCKMLRSIFAQDYPAVEVLVVDDGSTDGTQKTMEAWETEGKLRYFRNEKNSGPGYSRKRGLCEASGKYVIFADDDDIYTNPSFFSEAVRAFETKKELDLALVVGPPRIVCMETGEMSDANLPAKGFFSGKEYLSGFCDKYEKPHSTFTAVFLREKLLEAGTEKCKQLDDKIIYLRALITGNVFFLPDEAGDYHVHQRNFSKTVSSGFVISLFRETRQIYDAICKKGILSSPTDWWYSQSRLLLRFFIQSEQPRLWGLIRILIWLRRQHISLKRDVTLFRESLGYWLYRKKKAED